MKTGSIFIRSLLPAIVFISMIAIMPMAFSQAAPKQEDPLPPGSPQVMQSEELVRAMKSTDGSKPLILYVGPKTFYVQAHIAGAEFIGPTGKLEGMARLRNRVATIKKDKAVVIYCGCCPWDHCPNIRPAFAELTKAGFTNVRVLYLNTSFGADWKDKGYPVASGE